MSRPPQCPVVQQLRPVSVAPRPELAELREAAYCLVVDADGSRIPFGALYRRQKAIVVFVRNFLCYTCKEYVEDLAKVPRSYLQPFCSLTGYTHEMYVDPQREIYKMLGMKRGEGNDVSGNEVHFLHHDRNRLDHVPINSVLQLAGVKTVNFTNKPQIIDV